MKDASVLLGAAAPGRTSPLTPHADEPQRSASTHALARQTIHATRRPTTGSCRQRRSRHLEAVLARRVQTRQRRASSRPSLPTRSILLRVQFPMATCLTQRKAPNGARPAAIQQTTGTAHASAHGVGSASFEQNAAVHGRAGSVEASGSNLVHVGRVAPTGFQSLAGRHR